MKQPNLTIGRALVLIQSAIELTGAGFSAVPGGRAVKSPPVVSQNLLIYLNINGKNPIFSMAWQLLTTLQNGEGRKRHDD